MNRVAIIGAGRFGMALAESLSEVGVEVLLIERNGNLVQSALNVVSSAVQGDATNARALEDAGVRECDVAVSVKGSSWTLSEGKRIDNPHRAAPMRYAILLEEEVQEAEVSVLFAADEEIVAAAIAAEAPPPDRKSVV